MVRGGPELSDMGAVGNPHYLRMAAQMSARRLGLDRIDLYYLHTPTMTDAPFEEIVGTLAEMRQDGFIRHIGLSNVSADQLRTAISITDIAAVTRPLQRRRPPRRQGTAGSPGRGHRLLAMAPRQLPREARAASGSARSSTRSPRSTTPPRSRSPLRGSCTEPRRRCRSRAPPTSSTSRKTLAAAQISLTQDEVDAITALAPEDRDGHAPRG